MVIAGINPTSPLHDLDGPGLDFGFAGKFAFFTTSSGVFCPEQQKAPDNTVIGGAF